MCMKIAILMMVMTKETDPANYSHNTGIKQFYGNTHTNYIAKRTELALKYTSLCYFFKCE